MTFPRLRWALTAAVIGACISVTGCGASGDSGSASSGRSGGSGGSDGRSLTIGYAFPEVTSPYWVSMHYGVHQEAERLGVEVLDLDAGGNNNANQQITQIQNLTQRRVDAMIVGAVNADAIAPVVDQAVNSGIPVVGLGSIPNSRQLASIISADHHGMGVIEAQCLGEALRGDGSVALLTGFAGQTWAAARAEGFKEELARSFPKMSVAAESERVVDRNGANTTMADWLQRFSELRGVYSVTDDIGAGALDAIRDSGAADQVEVATANLTANSEQLVRSGGFACVASQTVVEQGRQAVVQAVAAAEGKPVERLVATEVIRIDAENLETVDRRAVSAPDGYTP